MKKLMTINKRGTTVIVVTHDLELVHEFGGRIITINSGEIESDIQKPSLYRDEASSDDDTGSDSEKEAAV